VDGFLDGLDRSLQEQNWYAALVMSLTLPDLCVKASNPAERTTGAKYAAWFDEFVGPKYRRPVGPDRQLHVFLSGNDCYALRCAVLHEGSADVTEQKARETLERFHFCTPGSRNNRWHRNQRDGALLLMVDEFATDVLEAARAWWESLDEPRREAARETHMTLLDSDSLTSW
jgi:hypothetical protein